MATPQRRSGVERSLVILDEGPLQWPVENVPAGKAESVFQITRRLCLNTEVAVCVLQDDILEWFCQDAIERGNNSFLQCRAQRIVVHRLGQPVGNVKTEHGESVCS